LRVDGASEALSKARKQRGHGLREIGLPRLLLEMLGVERNDYLHMKCSYAALAIAILSGWSAWADQIVLKNGDRVTGSIVKKDAKTVTVKTTHFGVVTVAWDQVESITADKPINVVLPEGKTVQGTLETAGGKVEVKAGGETRSVPLAEVGVLRDSAEQAAYERMLNPGLGDLWTVTGTLGLAATAGNAKTFSFTLPVSAARVTNTDKMTAYFNLIRASALINGVTATTAQAVRGGWGYNRNLHPRVFWNFFNDYEYDRFQNLDLRVVLGSGFGVGVWKGERGRLDAVGGLAYNRESFDPVRPLLPFVRNSAEAYWGDDLVVKVSSRASLTQSYRMFNNLKDSGAYRQNFDLAFTTKLTSWLTWNAAVSDRFLNRPVVGRKKNDVLYSTGLGFTFSR
jgi:putative salt-induced outer membrane protein YdiY